MQADAVWYQTGDSLIEATSGNTGIAGDGVRLIKGYKMHWLAE